MNLELGDVKSPAQDVGGPLIVFLSWMQTKVPGGDRMESNSVAALYPNPGKMVHPHLSFSGFLFGKVTMPLTTSQCGYNTGNMNSLYNQLHLCKCSIAASEEEVRIQIAKPPPVPGK